MLSLAIAALALALPISYASAATFTAPFPSSTSTVVDNGADGIYGASYCCFFYAGESVTQTYTGTGLASVDTVSIFLPIASDVLSSGQAVDFNVLLNGTIIGTTSWSSQSVGIDVFNASFPSIAAVGDTYSVELLETNTVPTGDGSIGLNYGSLTLTGTAAAAATPEPGTIGLFATSLISLGLIRLRRRTA